MGLSKKGEEVKYCVFEVAVGDTGHESYGAAWRCFDTDEAEEMDMVAGLRGSGKKLPRFLSYGS